jgi:hypothetical protein
MHKCSVGLKRRAGATEAAASNGARCRASVNREELNNRAAKKQKQPTEMQSRIRDNKNAQQH